MKNIGKVGLGLLLVILVASSVAANGARKSGATTYTITIPPSAATVGNRCLPACQPRKPILEYVEDGVALVLDVPLALLSPITCPIIAPVMDRINGSDSRSYDGYRRGR